MANPTFGETVRDDDEWAANPWQAQADAHVMRLREEASQQAFPQRAFPARTEAMPGGGAVAFGPVAHAALLCGLATPATALPSSAVRPPGMALRPSFVAVATTAPMDQTRAGSLDSVDDLRRYVNDLEGQVALMEEAAARREKEIGDFMTIMRASDSSKGSGRGGRDEAKQQADFAVEVDEMKKQNTFLAGIVSRFETKTMQLQEQINTCMSPKLQVKAPTATAAAQTDASGADKVEGCVGSAASVPSGEARMAELVVELASAERKAEIRASELAERELQVEALLGELESDRRKFADAEACVTELRETSEASAGQAQEQRETAQSAAVILRDVRQEHNRRTQELLRRLQASESDRTRLQALLAGRTKAEEVERKEIFQEEVHYTTKDSSDGVASRKATEATQGDEEMRELRSLNTELVKRLQEERAALSSGKEQLEAAIRDQVALVEERDMLQVRLASLSQQLYILVEDNEVLAAAKTNSENSSVGGLLGEGVGSGELAPRGERVAASPTSARNCREFLGSMS